MSVTNHELEVRKLNFEHYLKNNLIRQSTNRVKPIKAESVEAGDHSRINEDDDDTL